MLINFAAVIASLGRNAAFRIVNGARTPDDYVLTAVLPERRMASYSVNTGAMRIIPTMAGLVGMDSAYPPGGLVEVSTFLEKTAKTAIEVPLTEETLRELHQMLLVLRAQGQSTTQAEVNSALNFLDALVRQPLADTREYLRGRALSTGAIDWTFNRKRLLIDYGVPAGNKLTARAGNAGYGGNASVFWTDIQAMRRILGPGAQFLMHPDTADMVRYNPANAVATVAEGDSTVTFRRTVNAGAAFPQDTTDTVAIALYGREGEVINPADPSTTLRIPFIDRGKVIGIGRVQSRGFRVGDGLGAQEEQVTSDVALGYTHVAPTVEGGGVPGPWANLRTPDGRPWMLVGEGAQNVLPVIEEPTKLAIATTEMV